MIKRILFKSLICFSGLFFSISIEAQVVYSNNNPDVLFTYQSSPNHTLLFSMDGLSGDTLKFISNWELWENYIEISGIGGTWYLENGAGKPDTLPFNAIIDEEKLYRKNLASMFYCNDNCEGQWYNVTSKFLGFRFVNQEGSRYGWIRISTNNAQNNLVIHDYAYQQLPGQDIKAGEGLPIFAENLHVENSETSGTPEDLVLTYSHSILSQYISEYRIMVVPESEVENFDVSFALAVNETCYIAQSPLSNPSLQLPETITDIHGNTIVELFQYRLFILSISNDPDSIDHALSLPSESFAVLRKAPIVEQLLVDSEYTGGSTYSINVSFAGLEDSDGIQSYRFFIVPQQIVSDINLETLISCEHYQTINPVSGNNSYSGTYSNSVIRDINGDILNESNNYFGLVFSVPDEITYNYASFALCNTSFSVVWPCEMVDNVFVQDIGNSGNPTDLEINFMKASDETGILEYRIIIVPEDNVQDFNIEIANFLNELEYFAVTPTGHNISIALPNNARFFNGNSILLNQTFKVFIHAYPDSLSCSKSSLSLPSRAISSSIPNNFVTGQSSGNWILYSDIIPDSVLYPFRQQLIYSFDFDNDEISDASFIANHSSGLGGGGGYVDIETYGNTYVAVCDNESFSVDTLPVYCSIYDISNWNSGQFNMSYGGWSMPFNQWSGGSWYDKGLGYVAFRKQKEYGEIFAWVKIDVAGGYTLTIYDYAIDFSENGIKTLKKVDLINIYPNPVTDNFKVVTNEMPFPIEYSIFNLNGAIIMTGTIIENNESVSTIGLESGLYFISFCTDNFSKTIKLLKH